MKIQGAGVQVHEVINFTSARSARAWAPQKASESYSKVDAQAVEYDFSNMSRNEMKRTAQHLWEEGKIDLSQLGMIQMAGPLGKVGSSGEFVPFTEEERAQIDDVPIDYLALVKGAMDFIESRHEELDSKSGYANWRHILSVMEGPQTALPKVDVSA